MKQLRVDNCVIVNMKYIYRKSLAIDTVAKDDKPLRCGRKICY